MKLHRYSSAQTGCATHAQSVGMIVIHLSRARWVIQEVVDIHMSGYSETDRAKVKGGNLARLLDWPGHPKALWSAPRL